MMRPPIEYYLVVHIQENSDIEVDQHDSVEWCQKKFVLGMKQDQQYMLQ